MTPWELEERMDTVKLLAELATDWEIRITSDCLTIASLRDGKRFYYKFTDARGLDRAVSRAHAGEPS